MTEHSKARHATRTVHSAVESRLRVRYSECDPMAVAHHASYLPWLEIGRTDLLRRHGMTYAELEAKGVFLVVVRLDIRYRRPIRYDDLIEVRTSWVGGSRIKIEHHYEIRIVERDRSMGGTPVPPDDLAAEATSTLACVDKAGAVSALPEYLIPPQR